MKENKFIAPVWMKEHPRCLQSQGKVENVIIEDKKFLKVTQPNGNIIYNMVYEPLTEKINGTHK